MTLYSIPFTCSLAVRIALAEREIPYQNLGMRRFEHRLDDGNSYDEINPKRKVPALLLDDGELLTEIPAVLLFLDGLSGKRPEAEARRLLEWLCCIGTELHKAAMFPLFDPAAPQATRDDALARQLPLTLDVLEARLGAQTTLLGGEAPSVADYYLLWALLLLRFQHRAQLQRPALLGFLKRLSETPWIATVLAEERALLAQVA